MNIAGKVENLLKYCGGYAGHTYMIDERNDNDFNVVLPEEQEIRHCLPELKFILLTGEAGDGKTRLLRNLKDELDLYGFVPDNDFSELDPEVKEQRIRDIAGLLSGKENNAPKRILAANIGIFTKTVLRKDPELMLQLKSGRRDVLIVNFEKRNLAADQQLFRGIVTAFLEYDRDSPCRETDCPHRSKCVYRENIDSLLDKGMEGLRVLCDAVYLTGGHLTFRELLSLLSYLVTFGQDCAGRKREPVQEPFRYYQIFDKKGNILLDKFRHMDPARKRTRDVNKTYKSVADCVKQKRQDFFEAETDNRYELLCSDYLPQFKDVLTFLNNTKPYFFSTEEAQNVCLDNIKLGLSKIARAGNTNLKMTVADTPAALNHLIQTEFDLNTEIDTLWRRYDFDFQNMDALLPDSGKDNRFCLSYVYPSPEDGGLREVRMVIDYQLFVYLSMAADDYYLDRSITSVGEYVVNTFYRKVLKTMPEAYRKAHIKFLNGKTKELINFSLELKQKNRLLFGDTKIVRIEKEAEV